MKKIYVIKAVAFVAIFAVLLGAVSKVMTYPADYRNYQWVAGFYEEEENSLDAVYIGSSNCYAFWSPLTAWEEFGIAVFPYSTNAQPFIAAKYLIQETKKTQPDALFIVDINTLEDSSLMIESMHHLVDYMPFSLNKIALTKHLADAGGYSLSESMELYLPIIRYHDRWDELNPDDFNYKLDGLKGASTYYSFLAESRDISESYITTDEEFELEEELKASVNDLLDYCDEEQVKVLFVTVPRQEVDVDMVKRFNAVNNLIASRGYPTLNLNGMTEEVGIDLTKDYYNDKHTNIHGAIKFTRYLSEYLIENYHLEDKRGNEAYAGWDNAWNMYKNVLAPYVPDVELDGAHLTDALEAPADLSTSMDEKQVYVTWSPVANADGYRIYRKTGDEGNWQQITETSECSYADEEAITSKGGWYFYTVVPYYEENGEKYYGDFSYTGAEIVTL